MNVLARFRRAIVGSKFNSEVFTADRESKMKAQAESRKRKAQAEPNAPDTQKSCCTFFRQLFQLGGGRKKKQRSEKKKHSEMFCNR